MSNLLTKYELIKEAQAAQELEKTATAEELEIIEKYATAADDLLAMEYGNDYTAEDVEKLATMMINHDASEASAPVEEDVEKIAALEEAGQIIALSFLETLKNAQ